MQKLFTISHSLKLALAAIMLVASAGSLSHIHAATHPAPDEKKQADEKSVAAANTQLGLALSGASPDDSRSLIQACTMGINILVKKTLQQDLEAANARAAASAKAAEDARKAKDAADAADAKKVKPYRYNTCERLTRWFNGEKAEKRTCCAQTGHVMMEATLLIKDMLQDCALRWPHLIADAYQNPSKKTIGKLIAYIVLLEVTIHALGFGSLSMGTFRRLGQLVSSLTFHLGGMVGSFSAGVAAQSVDEVKALIETSTAQSWITWAASYVPSFGEKVVKTMEICVTRCTATTVFPNQAAIQEACIRACAGTI